MVKLLSETPVLDKGYVALHSCSPTGQELLLLGKEFFRGQKDAKLFDVAYMHLKIKCPLFVQMTFPEFGLRYIVQRSTQKPEAFIPTVNQVNAISLEASEAIQQDIEQTTAALLINPKAYQSEHCDLFVSQVISPISVYNTLLVYGSLEQWNNYVSQTGLPAPIEAYRKVIDQVLMSEYGQLSRG